MSDLELISTDDLIEEVASRHSEIIVIRNCEKKANTDNVYVKTQRGPLSREDKNFDLVEAQQMLQAASVQLTYDFLGDTKCEQ